MTLNHIIYMDFIEYPDEFKLLIFKFTDTVQFLPLLLSIKLYIMSTSVLQSLA